MSYRRRSQNKGKMKQRGNPIRASILVRQADRVYSKANPKIKKSAKDMTAQDRLKDAMARAKTEGING